MDRMGSKFILCVFQNSFKCHDGQDEYEREIGEAVIFPVTALQDHLC